jgi:hypothetical protein
MSYVVDIIGSYPPVSPDAWTRARLEESTTRNGTFALIDTFALDPVDADPEQPQARAFHSTKATLPAGWYRLAWQNEAGDSSVSEPVFAGSGIRPAVGEVAALMPDRTTVDGGSEARTFNTLTSPTATEVEGLIDMVLDSVDPRVPDGASAEVERAARHVVTLTTAILVESGNWGDQLDTNEARVALWERLLAAHEATLDAAANQDEPGQSRFGSVSVLSPTLTSYGAMTGFPTSELLP